jgi:hypothetical protein
VARDKVVSAFTYLRQPPIILLLILKTRQSRSIQQRPRLEILGQSRDSRKKSEEMSQHKRKNLGQLLIISDTRAAADAVNVYRLRA